MCHLLHDVGVGNETTMNITNDYNFVTIFPYNVNNFLPYVYFIIHYLTVINVVFIYYLKFFLFNF